MYFSLFANPFGDYTWTVLYRVPVEEPLKCVVELPTCEDKGVHFFWLEEVPYKQEKLVGKVL
jgi:hypothetical protein